MAAPPHPTTAPDTHDRHLSYIHTDLPPVAIDHRVRSRPRDSAAVGSDGHTDRVVAEDLFVRSQRGLLDATFPIRRRQSFR